MKAMWQCIFYPSKTGPAITYGMDNILHRVAFIAHPRNIFLTDNAG
jgi:hypothetical protein